MTGAEPGARRRRGLLAAVTMVAAGLLLTAPGGTRAGWHTEVSATLPDGASDRFTMTAVDVSSPWGTTLNSPTVQTSNTSERHRGVLTATAGGVRAGVWPESAGLASALTVTYQVGPVGGTCAGTLSPISGAVLAPGTTRPVCARLSTPTLTDAQLLLNHAGRSAVVTTNLGQNSAAPATWSAAPVSVESTARVTFPRPTPRNNSMTDVTASCERVNRGLGLVPNARLHWAWPDAAGSTPIATPAVDRWVVFRQHPTTGTWTQYGQPLAGSARNLLIPAADLGSFPVLNVGYNWKIVGYPRAGTAAYAESTHQVTTWETLLFSPCISVSANPAPTPVVGFP